MTDFRQMLLSSAQDITSGVVHRNGQGHVFVAGAKTTMLGRALVRRLEQQRMNCLAGVDDAPDLLDAQSVERFFFDARPAYVIVAAGRTAGIAGNQQYPADLMLDNLLVATHVIPAAWRYGVTKLL